MDDNNISAPSASDPAPATTIPGPAPDETDADNRTLPGAEPAGVHLPGADAAGDDLPSAELAGGDLPGVDVAGADLAAAVDGLTELETTPVHTHAARYSDVHSVLQDALSDTDRGGANPR